MMRSSDCPSASAGVKPNMRSAAGFHTVMAPRASVTTTASPTAFTSWPKSISAGTACSSSDGLGRLKLADLLAAVAQVRQHLLGVLAQQRRAGDLGLQVRELDRAADSKVGAALL